MSISNIKTHHYTKIQQPQPNQKRATGCPYYIDTIYEGGSGTLNEDCLVVKKNLFAVFDGASSITSNRWQGKSGAWWAAQCASHTIATSSDLLYKSFNQANQAIAQTMTKAGINQKKRLNLWSCTGAAIRLHPHYMEYAQIGDALILCIKNDGSYFLPAPYHNHDHDTLAAWKALALKGCSDIRNKLSEQIASTRLRMNRTFGVLNGEPEMNHFLRSGTLSLEGIKNILMFTDGLHWPAENLSEKEDFSALVSSYLNSGLKNLHQRIRAIEKNDPKCLRFPRFKQHDDIAAVALSFHS